MRPRLVYSFQISSIYLDLVGLVATSTSVCGAISALGKEVMVIDI